MSLRELPSVDRLLVESPELIREYGRPLTTQVIRAVLAEARAGPADTPPTPDHLLAETQQRLAALTTPSLQAVINATGVILHTNLGRAPLSRAALAQMEAVGRGYSSLEYDVARGERGSRADHAESTLLTLTGAEAALVVNNNAAALLLALTALTKGKRVAISRGQLVEIGGGFRVPDVMKQSGAKLLEVGSTNRTHLADFKAAVDEGAALILRAHPSNFKIVGYTSSPSLAELCGLGVPVVDDLGSGALLDTSAYGLAHEPTVQESLAAGAALVTFSGDKLLGGPQAGIIVGRRELVHKLKRHPLARALRADKLCLAALNATLLHYARDEAEREIPVWRMLALPLATLEARARAWAERLGAGTVVAGESTVGGGSLPGESVPTRLLALDVKKPNALAARLRAQTPPIVARVAESQLLLDPRTVSPEDEPALLRGLRSALQEHGQR